MITQAKFVGGIGGREPERTGAGRVRETGEERAGSGISTMMGRPETNSKRQVFVILAYV